MCQGDFEGKRRLDPCLRHAGTGRNILIVQDEFCKIIDVVRRKLCFLRVYLGNVR
jgi:hypothetical protein